MNDTTRSDALSAIEQLARRYPHWRLGQLVANIAGWTNVEIWEVEDHSLLDAARRHLEKLNHQSSTIVAPIVTPTSSSVELSDVSPASP